MKFVKALAKVMQRTSTYLAIVFFLFVCVSHPVQKGPTRFRFHSSRGMERAYEAPCNEVPHMTLGHQQGRLLTYLHCDITLLFSRFFNSMVVHVHDSAPFRSFCSRRVVFESPLKPLTALVETSSSILNFHLAVHSSCPNSRVKGLAQRTTFWIIVRNETLSKCVCTVCVCVLVLLGF